MSYRIRRIDHNQNEIVKFFRENHCKVFITSSLGNGFPDIIVKIKDNIFLIEIKDGKKSPSQQALTVKEIQFHDAWYPNVCIINSLEAAKDWLNKIVNCSSIQL
jgi:hypothetical protein